MGWLSRFLSRGEERDAGGLQWMPNFVGMFNSVSDAGGSATADSALTFSAVWRSASILSDAMVGLPVRVLDEANEKQVDHQIPRLLHNDGDANEYMSAVAAKSAMMVNQVLWGNSYAAIERDASGLASALYPMPSRNTQPRRVNGQLFYQTNIAGQSHTLYPQDVLHIMGPLTIDGLVGLNPIEYQRQTVGLSVALEKFAAKFFSNGGNVGGIIETPPMKEEALKNFIESWRQRYAGLDNAFKIGVLTGGMKFVKTTADPAESQALDSRVHQVLEIARIFGIPPHMLGVMDKASYASIEQQNMEFYQGTVQPYVIRWEAELGRKLMAADERRRLTVSFNMDSKLRGTTRERYASYQLGRQAGFLSVNDIRTLENLPKVKGGDTLLEPLNMQPIGTADSLATDDTNAPTTGQGEK